MFGKLFRKQSLCILHPGLLLNVMKCKFDMRDRERGIIQAAVPAANEASVHVNVHESEIYIRCFRHNGAFPRRSRGKKDALHGKN